MAIYHCSIKVGSKGKGQSAIAASAYRSGQKLIDNSTGLVSDYTRKHGIVFSEVSLCQNAPAEYANRETLWNAVHEIEKAKNSQLWREFEVALPQELNRTEQIDTVRDFVKILTEQGMCVDWSLHDKGDGNPHAHIMATMRSITEDGKWAPKSYKVYDLDEYGERIYQRTDKQGRKQYKSHKKNYNDWNDLERIEEWRAAWATCCNSRLAMCEQIDHRSYKRQGIDQEPTIHESYAARQIAARGGFSEQVHVNEQIRRRNAMLIQITEQLRNIEQQLAMLIQEKGSAAINAGKQRIADLLARRSRAIDSDDRRPTNGERTAEGRIERAAPSATDLLIRQSEIERRTTSSHTEHKESESREREIAEQRRTVEAERNTEETSKRARKTSRYRSR